jgi:DNA polymerase elongation subunit (family B)
MIKRVRELPSEGVEYVYDLETENHHFAVGPGNLIVHNTDSLFVCFNPRNPETGERLQGREAIVKTIELTEEAGHFITQALKAPHDFEYDKVFYPFIIFSKKRYVGNKYEESPDEFKETSMGIVLKRRDNAPLLKMIYGGAIDKLLNGRDIAGATAFVQEKVKDLVDGYMKLSQLTITKSLAADYEGTPPAHKMLADRITARDPGNAPASGDRVGFVYIQPSVGQKASKLQGDRIETPQYIEENGLKADTEYYIEHQLMNPLSQLFGILLENMPGFVEPVKWSSDPDKLIAQRELMAGELLFRRGLQRCQSAATVSFITKNFGGNTVTVEKRQPRKVSAPPALPPQLAAVAPKKQGLLDSFLKQTAVMTDELLAKNMRVAKRAAAAEKKKP